MTSLNNRDIPLAIQPKSITGTTRGKKLATYKSNVVFTQRQKEISIGLLLGDGSLQTQNKGKNYRLKYQLTEKNYEYANQLVHEFRPWILSDPHAITRINENNKTVKSLGFQTFADDKLNYLSDLFIAIENGKRVKRIAPKLVQNHVSPISLAYWFMDDGGKLDYGPNQGKGIVFNTQGFPHEDVESLVKGLKDKFEFNCWVKPNRGKSIIAISGKNFEKFQNLVGPHIIPSMQYKLPTERKKPRI